MTMHPAARVASTKGTSPQYDVLTAALRAVTCQCPDCLAYAYVSRGTLSAALRQAPSTTRLAMAKRGFVTIDKCGARIVGAYVTDLGRRWQAREAEAMGWAERTTRIVRR